jgi:hypothetical protein
MADKGPLLVTDALTKVFDRARAVDNVGDRTYLLDDLARYPT